MEVLSGNLKVGDLIRVLKGERYKTGLIEIIGNDLTKDAVIRRHVRRAPRHAAGPAREGAVDPPGSE